MTTPFHEDDINAAPHCLPPQAASAPTTPILKDFAGATDCHCHVFEDPVQYPFAKKRTYTPAQAPLRDYLRMCESVGLLRTVQVNASVYGNDNRLSLDVISALGQHRARGVAGVAPDAPPAEIERLHLGGMRGVRLSTQVVGYGGTEHLEAMARKIKPFGWHLQIHVADGRELAELEQRLLRVDAPLVFDHLGCVHGKDGISSAGFGALLRLLKNRDDCWVKVSSWYRRSAVPAPHADMKALSQAVVACRPDRVLFGTNWPHPSLFSPQTVPRDADLVATFLDWVPDPHDRQAILVSNPEALYGFASA